MPGTGGATAWANVGLSGVGNNGDTRGFDTLFGDGTGGPGSDLAVFPAADYTPANRSHFDSRDYWFAGALQKMTTGWLGRWLDLYGSPDNPLQAVSLDSSISKQIRTVKAPVSAVTGLTGVEFRVDNVSASAGEPHRADGAAVAGPGGRGQRRAGRARATSSGAPCRCRARCGRSPARRSRGATRPPTSRSASSSPRRSCRRTSA